MLDWFSCVCQETTPLLGTLLVARRREPEVTMLAFNAYEVTSGTINGCALPVGGREKGHG